MMENMDEESPNYSAGAPNDGGTPATSQKSMVSEADLPVEGSQRVLATESADRSPSNRRIMYLAAIIIIVLLAIVIGLSVGLSQRSKSSGSASAFEGSGPPPSPTKPPVQGPTLSPEEEEVLGTKIKDFLVISGVARSDIDDPSTPQGQAVSFLESTGRPVPDSPDSDEGYNYLATFVLSSLYWAMNGPLWGDNFFFNENPDPCTWTKQRLYAGAFGEIRQEGVLCSQGEIVAIELPLNNLRGELPTELGLLTRLQAIGMAQNSIGGSIPTEIGDMSALIIISLEYNALEGVIPATIGNLNNLGIFAVSQNTMRGPLPETFSNLNGLVGLGLDDNAFTGELSAINNFDQLRLLFLEDNGFKQTADANFLSGVFGQLIQLDVSDNELDGELPQHFFLSDTLEVLDVHGNKFSGPLPEFPQNVKLQFFALHENDFEGPIPATISNLRGLMHLDVTSNKLTEFGPSLSGLVQLEYLFMANNDFVQGPVPDFLRDLIALKDLSLKDTQRTGEIPTWFGELDNLIYLDLDSNQLGGEIPSEIGDMVSLVFLQLQRNNLTGQIPESFGNLTSFQYIDVENNTLTGSMSVLCDIKIADTWLVADCGGDNPEIECGCCTTCCEDANSETCNDLDMLAQLDPIWENGYDRNRVYLFQDFNITGDNTPTARSLLR